METQESSKKIKVGLVQINNSFDRQNYLPLSIGLLHSYAETHAPNFADFEFLEPIYKRMHPEQAAEHLADADIVAFSTYVWNFELSKEISRRVKQKNPEKTVLFGGPHVPAPFLAGQNYLDLDGRLAGFLKQNDFIDFVIPGEGETAFASFLANYPSRNWDNVPTLHYLQNGQLVQNLPASRIRDLNDIPSPYLSGFFSGLMEKHPDEEWIALLETNRGCPFGCSYCDWGSVAKSKIADYDLETRIFSEIDWFSDNKIGFVFCCDANFGIFKERDMQIAQRFADNKGKYGYPKRLSVQNTKNSTDISYHIQKVLVDAGLDQGALLAFQSLNPDTLKAVGRGNIKQPTYHALQKRFTEAGITTFSDIILGLPLETYESFTGGVSTLIENGQHNRIQFNNLSILPNAPMMRDKEKYGLQIVELDIINVHGRLDDWAGDVHEKQQLVVSTNTMPPEDWVKARNFGYMVSFLHFDKLLQIPNVVLNKYYGISYKDIANAFVENPLGLPTIRDISSLFSEHARALQKGRPEYIHSPQWLDIWWPADEFAFIQLATEEKLGDFYHEAQLTLENLLSKRGVSDSSLLSPSIELNKAMIKLPFNETDFSINLPYNVLELYKNGLVSEKIDVEASPHTYQIDRTSNRWDSWEKWYREVIWWGNKKGDYLYQCK
jgi:hypothetical protein